ncbi:hypothetical protein BH09MYX1_BH09MYX1_67280 [soil metagenome]
MVNASAELRRAKPTTRIELAGGSTLVGVDAHTVLIGNRLGGGIDFPNEALVLARAETVVGVMVKLGPTATVVVAELLSESFTWTVSVTPPVVPATYLPFESNVAPDGFSCRLHTYPLPLPPTMLNEMVPFVLVLGLTGLMARPPPTDTFTSATLPSAPPGTVAPDPAATSTATATATPTAASAGHVRPALDTACKTSPDCEATMPGIAGSDLCCSGCVWKAANKTSVTRFRDDCKASPPDMCPAVGCASPRVHAACEAGHCVLVVEK